MNKKNILVVCGTSVATSTVVAEALKERLPEHGVELGTVTKAKTSEARGKVSAGSFDIIVATTPLDQSKFDIPVIRALSFITGQGEEESLKEIVDALND